MSNVVASVPVSPDMVKHYKVETLIVTNGFLSLPVFRVIIKTSETSAPVIVQCMGHKDLAKTDNIFIYNIMICIILTWCSIH